MKISYYNEKHLQACADLLTHYYNQPDFGCHFTTKSATLYLQELIFTPRFVGFLLFDKKDLLGFAFSHMKTWSDKNELQLNEFIIKPDATQQGYGNKLLEFIETYASSYELSGITLATNTLSLIDFCRKNNFLEHDITFLYKGIKPA